MILPSLQLDLLNLIYLPLMVITIKDLATNWKSVWDDHLTGRDRFILQKVVIFLLMPIVVYCHEMGHALSIEYFGGKVAEFHFGLFWGFVVPSGTFTADQTVITFLAGNAVQIAIGLLAGIAALFISSPPVVAMLVYLALWSVGGTVVIYALMSATGYYGDWIAIYTAPTPVLKTIIGTVHAALVVLVAYCIYGATPRLWFAMRTKPKWAQRIGLLVIQADTEPTPRNCLAVAWCYAEASLFGQSDKWLKKAITTGAAASDAQMLSAYIAMNKGRTQQAGKIYDQVGADNNAPAQTRVKAYLGLADCYVRQNNFPKAIETYTKAIDIDHNLGDARLYKLLLLKQIGKKLESEKELLDLKEIPDAQCHWIDTALDDYYQKNLKDA